MKRIATQKNGFWKRVVINIPFILMIALMIALFGGGLLLLFYAIASCFAFKSAMVFLVLAGAGLIAIGIGIGFIDIYKKYYAFYNKKMGWEFPDVPQKEEKTVHDKITDGDKLKIICLPSYRSTGSGSRCLSARKCAQSPARSL